MEHQLQIERQLLCGQPLKHRQHVVIAIGADEVIGVFDAGVDSLELGQLTESKLTQKLVDSARDSAVNTAIAQEVNSTVFTGSDVCGGAGA